MRCSGRGEPQLVAVQIKFVFKLFIYLLNVLLEASTEHCSLNCDLNESSQQEKSITFYVGEHRKKYERERETLPSRRKRATKPSQQQQQINAERQRFECQWQNDLIIGK